MISIVIPTLNEVATLEATLATLIGSLHETAYELIVSDGGSTDGTIDIARRFTPHVVLKTGNDRQTIGIGRNLGAASARGEFLVFMDADVILPHPDAFFRELRTLFESDPQLAGVTVSLRVSAEKETSADRFCFGLVNLWHTAMNNMLRTGSASGEFQMIRTSSFRDARGYREDLVVCEDNDLFERLAKSGHTRMHRSLIAFHSGRRAHKTGWPRLLLSWWMNALSLKFRGKSYSGEWTQIRSDA